jgi:DNA-binding transcriptional ArsR family regulator
VALRFHLPDAAAEHIALRCSPLLETVLSLHVLVEPKHHSLQHSWVRKMRRMPPQMRQEIASLSLLYRSKLPNFVFPRAGDGLRSFDDELAGIRTLDADVLALDLSRTIASANGGWISEPASPADFKLGEAGALVERFAALLELYWEEAFAEEWDRLEPQLALASADTGRRLAAETLNTVLNTVSPPLRVKEVADGFWIDLPQDDDVEINADRPLVLVASAYVWPHIVASWERQWPTTLVYPAPFVAEDARPRIPDDELLQRLKALADDTRLRALRLIAERPRSTKELAPLLPITEAGLSKHLRQLAEARLVERRREGHYIVYSITRDGTATVSQALRRFLGGSP